MYFLLGCIFRANIFCSGVFRCVCVCLGVLLCSDCIECIKTGEIDPNILPRPIMDEDGKYIQSRMDTAQSKSKFHLLNNTFWLFPHFDIYIQTPDDPMHMVNLGLWTHILETIFVDMKNCLSAPTKTTAGGKEKRIISEKQLDEVWFLFAYFLRKDFFYGCLCFFVLGFF